MEIFDEFIVVDEKVISELTIAQFNVSTNCTFRDVTQFAALQFTTSWDIFQIKDIGNVSSKPPNAPATPLAQIVYWNWDQNGAQKINDTNTLKKGRHLGYGCCAYASPSFIIRILKKREKKSDENAFSASFNSLPDDDLIVKIGDKQIAVSAHWLSSVSPVISRMLSVEMKEKQQRMITLDELAKNVLMLLKLADYFQVIALKSRCETHLVNCVEIPLIDRFLLIERYGFDNLKNYFLHLDVNKLRAFFNANHEQFLPVISKEFLCALSVRALAGL